MPYGGSDDPGAFSFEATTPSVGDGSRETVGLSSVFVGLVTWGMETGEGSPNRSEGDVVREPLRGACFLRPDE